MIKELVIKNFAIIDRLDISFGPGLSCLTGETGAGKSILVDAISVALGGKASPAMTGPGEDGVVEAAFDISGLPEVKERLIERGLDGGDELIIRRVVSASGRGKAYVNSSLANLSLLQEIGDLLVDMHGQHDHQSLLKADSHLGLLDSYLSLTKDAEMYRAGYDRLEFMRKRRDELTADGRERARRIDLLRFQKDEIDKAGLAPGEEEELKAERAKLLHADRLRAWADSALDLLKDSDAPALSLVGDALKAVGEIAEIVPEQAECRGLLEGAEVSISEACSSLRAFAGSLEADPERLDKVEGRLDLLSRLKKKYGEDIGEVLLYQATITEELSGLEGGEGDLARLDAEIEEADVSLKKAAAGLRQARMEGATGFSGKVLEELKGLGMPKARFEAGFEALGRPGPRGFDRVEFLISANPGEALKPLSKVASGGELSRVMLALKVILARADRVPTLIFDEVDSGVGGLTAGAVGRKLREVAGGRQVLCITHLPQIASLAAEHYLVEKTVHDGRTRASVRKLDMEGRVREVARMLGGEEGSSTASAHAEELVRQGEFYG